MAAGRKQVRESRNDDDEGPAPAGDGYPEPGYRDSPDDVATGLEIFTDEDGQDVQTYFYRLAENGQQRGPQHGYCHKVVGTVDPDALAAALGGGLYRVIRKRGRVIDGPRLLIRIAGAPRVYEPPGPVGGPMADYAAAAKSAGDAPPAWFERLTQRLDAIEKSNHSDPVQQLVSLGQVARMLAPADSAANAASMLGLVEKSFEAGRKLGGAGAPDDSVAGMVREIVQGVLQVAAARRPTLPGAPPAAPRAAAGLSELDTEGDLIRVLVRSLVNGLPADDCAETVRDLLSEPELEMANNAPLPTVLDRVRAATPNATPQARAELEAYTEQVLAALKRPAPEVAE